MKQVVFYTLAAGLVLGAGCSKKTETTAETKPAKEAAPQPTAVQSKAEAVKSMEIATATMAKAEEVLKQAEESSKKAVEVSKQATAAVTAMKVKAEDVMADLNLSVDQIKEKVSGFDVSQVMAYADSYQDVILEKKDQLADLAGQLKGLSVTEMLGDKAKSIKSQLSQYTEQLSGLKDRYGVYLDQLKAFGVDLSAYGL